MKNPLPAPKLRGTIRARESELLRIFCETGHPTATTKLIPTFSADEGRTFLRHPDLPADGRAELFKSSTNKNLVCTDTHDGIDTMDHCRFQFEWEAVQ